jgi:HEAT repeat protein
MVRGETDAETRRSAIEGLGRAGDVESGKVLLELVKSGPEDDRLRAVQAIHSIRDPATVEVLAQDYDGLDATGRQAILGAGARLPQPAEQLAKVAREKGLLDEEARVRTISARLLGRFKGRDENVEALGAYLSRCQHPSEWNAALSALESIGTRKAADEAMNGLGVVPNLQTRQGWRDKFAKIYENTTPRDQ